MLPPCGAAEKKLTEKETILRIRIILGSRIWKGAKVKSWIWIRTKVKSWIDLDPRRA
jgi:hypothetical protein